MAENELNDSLLLRKSVNIKYEQKLKAEYRDEFNCITK